MSMGRSFRPTEANTEAFGGIRSQVPLPVAMLAVVMQNTHTLPPDVVSKASFSGCLIAAAHSSGKEDQEIALEIHISQGYMSRFMRGVAQQWAKRLIAFMRATNSRAPLQWIADQMGCDVVMRDTRAAEVAALRSRLQELERAA